MFIFGMNFNPSVCQRYLRCTNDTLWCTDGKKIMEKSEARGRPGPRPTCVVPMGNAGPIPRPSMPARPGPHFGVPCCQTCAFIFLPVGTKKQPGRMMPYMPLA